MKPTQQDNHEHDYKNSPEPITCWICGIEWSTIELQKPVEGLSDEKHSTRWEKEFDEIGFGNQARIPGGKYGAKRVELKDFIKQAITSAVEEERASCKEKLDSLRLNKRYPREDSDADSELMCAGWNQAADEINDKLNTIKV